MYSCIVQPRRVGGRTSVVHLVVHVQEKIIIGSFHGCQGTVQTVALGVREDFGTVARGRRPRATVRIITQCSI